MIHSIENNQALKLLMLSIALLVGACSSSTDSSPSAESTAIDSNQNDVSTAMGSNQNNDSLSDDTNQNDTPTTMDSNQNNESPPADANQIDTSPEVTDPVTADPLTPSVTRVDFDIGVPFYSSDSLKVDLTWGDQTISAQWVGDVFWSASADLLSNTENLLVVTFYDQNGAITLGNVESNFKTGMDSAQTVQIMAEQFNTSAWDSDNDGISNLDESIAGTDPLVDENALLDVRESLDFSTIGTYSVDFYEAQIPEQRPYFEHIEETVNCCTTGIVTVDIDESGAGTYFTEYKTTSRNSGTSTNRETGTRTSSENSIAWDGTSYWYNSGAAVGRDSTFNYTTTKLDNNQHSIVGLIHINSNNLADPNDSYIEFSLIGEVIEGTQRCAPVSGTVSREYYRQVSSRGNKTITASKTASDQYWSVVTNTDEAYFVNDIGTTFRCNFADWEQ